MCATLLIPAFASSSQNQLEQIALSLIDVTTTKAENGSIQTTYSSLDSFINYVKENYNYSDYDLGLFIMKYTKLYNDEFVSDFDVLETLNFLEITVSSEIIAVSETGVKRAIAAQDIVPFSDWTSSDGYLQITTTSSKEMVNNQARYVISGYAVWLKIPAVQESDVFVLTSNATFDDSYAERGYFSQNEYCVSHNHSLSRYSDVTESYPYGDGIKLEYRSGYPGISFDFHYLCDQNPYGNVTDPSKTRFAAFIKYRVIPQVVGGTYSAQASYSHKTFGGKIDWSLGLGGLQPSFTVVGTKSDYFARPITLQ